MIEKIINGGNYQPTITDKIVLDSTPTVNSLNGVTSDAVARAIAGASGEVPQVTENDNGKVLSAIYDEGGPAVEWAEAPSGLPDTTGASQGDVLTIGSTGPEWSAVPQELPASLGTAGQVLTVNSGATGVEWATPSGGSGGVVMLDYTETDKNLFNAAVAGITNGQPVFVTRSPDQTFTFTAIPLVQKTVDVNGNVTVTELCFTCVRVQNADNASIAAYVSGFALKKTATYNPDTGTTSNSFTRTVISRALQFAT